MFIETKTVKIAKTVYVNEKVYNIIGLSTNDFKYIVELVSEGNPTTARAIVNDVDYSSVDLYDRLRSVK